MAQLFQSETPSKLPRTPRLRLLIALACVVFLAILVSGFVWWPRSPADLDHADRATTAEWVKAWQAGEIVALVRHTERCDRSSNTCLGPADGITEAGNLAAAAVGQGFVRLGMQQTHVLSSPLTRTAQTAHSMFGHDASTEDWLATCGPTLRDEIVANKTPQHNLILVTHSGCISDFEKQSGFPHAIAAEYGSVLLVRINHQQKLSVLGILNTPFWQTTSAH
ncbi:histidine phosphatase family protein [Pseudomonas sp. PB103]|uniref:lipopolysaccharide core heptose(II)-phosphate phosphatase PmrG n=1 Tax=Pseudomonas sp. PB103 TaxID=2494698 RepID=UPI003532540B